LAEKLMWGSDAHLRQWEMSMIANVSNEQLLNSLSLILSLTEGLRETSFSMTLPLEHTGRDIFSDCKEIQQELMVNMFSL
jgi:hypothetical protein